MEKLTVSQALFNLFLWGVIFFTLYPASKYPYKLSKSRKKFGYALLLLFCLYAFYGGDYFHYMEQYPSIKQGDAGGTEPIYVWIAQNIGVTYTLFRLVIWGTALTFLSYTYKRIKLDINWTWYCFVAMSLLSFSYARVSLSMACMFLGFSILCFPTVKHKNISYALGFLLILSSYFFHKTAVFGIVMVFISMIIGQMSKKKILLSFITFPLLIGLFFYIITEVFRFVGNTDVELLFSERTLQTYISDEIEESGQGIAQKMLGIMYRVPIYLTTLLYVRAVFTGSIVRIPESIQRFFTVFFLIVIGSLIFYFNPGGFNTYVLFYRFLNFSIIPISVVLSVFYLYNLERKNVKIILTLGIVSSISTILYSIYCAAVGA